MKFQNLEKLLHKDLDTMKLSQFWSENERSFSPMHNIHVYPAKFPAFLASKSFQYAKRSKIEISNVADIFCGCGTTALESTKMGYNFWGVDSNPVATLITRVKTSSFDPFKLDIYFDIITREFEKNKHKKVPKSVLAHERLNYWFEEHKIIELFHLKQSIEKNVRNKKYNDFFLCAFSNILKKTSIWLQKSIKPTRDLEKKTHPVLSTYRTQFNMMRGAVIKCQTLENKKTKTKCSVKTGSILNQRIKEPFVDLLLTSPPYVTSYEYADLHQLSTLWLGYTQDFRQFRKDSIGSTYGASGIDQFQINEIGRDIVQQLEVSSPRQAKSVAKYFHDMTKAIQKLVELIRPGGLGIIIIGNTEYGGVKVDNAKYLAYELMKINSTNLSIYKREIGRKFLTRFRSANGRFSQEFNSKNIYHCEFIITFEKSQLPCQAQA